MLIEHALLKLVLTCEQWLRLSPVLKISARVRLDLPGVVLQKLTTATLALVLSATSKVIVSIAMIAIAMDSVLAKMMTRAVNR